MTLAIWPAALAPIACMRRKFEKSSLLASFCTTRAAIGNALMPAAPISGLNLPPLSTLSSLPNRTPAVVSRKNASRPRPRMARVPSLRNWSPLYCRCRDVRGGLGNLAA